MSDLTEAADELCDVVVGKSIVKSVIEEGYKVYNRVITEM